MDPLSKKAERKWKALAAQTVLLIGCYLSFVLCIKLLVHSVIQNALLECYL